MRALGQVLLSLLAAVFLTVLSAMVLACTPIGVIGLTLALLLFVAFFLIALHIAQVEWGL
jgi:hypothetical protein